MFALWGERREHVVEYSGTRSYEADASRGGGLGYWFKLSTQIEDDCTHLEHLQVPRTGVPSTLRFGDNRLRDSTIDVRIFNRWAFATSDLRSLPIREAPA